MWDFWFVFLLDKLETKERKQKMNANMFDLKSVGGGDVQPVSTQPTNLSMLYIDEEVDNEDAMSSVSGRVGSVSSKSTAKGTSDKKGGRGISGSSSSVVGSESSSSRASTKTGHGKGKATQYKYVIEFDGAAYQPAKIKKDGNKYVKESDGSVVKVRGDGGVGFKTKADANRACKGLNCATTQNNAFKHA